jgi:phosphoribulokinase
MKSNLNSKLQSLLPTFAAKSDVAGLNGGEMALLLTKSLEKQGIAILVLTYPEVDARNHRSLDSLSHKLQAHGFGEIASLVHAETPFVMFDDLASCMKVYHEIQLDSVAISAQLFYAGLHGHSAEKAIDALLHPVEKPVLAHAA